MGDHPSLRLAEKPQISHRRKKPSIPRRTSGFRNSGSKTTVERSSSSSPLCRGMYGYTGTYKGERITVMASGMGTPSLMVYMTELCRDHGAREFVCIGTCGAVWESLTVNDLVMSTATSTTSGINLYDLPCTFAPAADFDLCRKAWEQAKKAGLELHAGSTLCNDHFYVENKHAYSRKREKWGILASDQERVGLCSVAAREGVKALMLLRP